ncbi:MAG: competence protein ComE [Clostridiales bacterium]|nr:MAG: competence protein ComE [Clostridiales bacterium]
MARRKSNHKALKALLSLLIVAVIAVVSYFTEPWQYLGGDKKEIGHITEASVTDLQVHYIDVGQADSILVRIPTENGTKNMLIDAGTSEGYPASNIENYLSGLGISELEYLVITHPHLDHIGAADEVITNFSIQNIIMPECEASTASFLRVLSAMDEKGLTYIPSEAGKTYTIGEASFTILGPVDAAAVNPDDANNYSVVIRLDFGDTSFIFTGDAETASEEEMLAHFPASDFKCNVLKVGHHGSTTSTSDAFLAACDPSLAVISCGKDNSYGHPHGETLDKLEAAGIPVLRTDEEGTIVLCSDKKEVFRLTTNE